MNNSFLNNLDHETVIRKTDINKMTERRRFKLIGLAVLFLLIALTLVLLARKLMQKGQLENQAGS